MKFGIKNLNRLIICLIILLLVVSITYAQFSESTEELLSPAIDSAGSALSRGFNRVNAFFTGEGIKAYARIIDFIVFFIIFTTIFLIGLRTAFKDKAISRQINALGVALGLMATLALMFGGTFLGKPITIVSIFPFALWFLIGVIPFIIIYWILHLLMGKKHPIWAFLLALLITAIIVFLIFMLSSKFREAINPGAGKLETKFGLPLFKKGEPPIKEPINGYFRLRQKDKFVNKDDRDLTPQEEATLLDLIKRMASECTVHIETKAGKEHLPSSGEYGEEQAKANNIKLAKDRCNHLRSLVQDDDLDDNDKCEKGKRPAYIVSDSSAVSARSFKIECKSALKAGIGKGIKPCRELENFNAAYFFEKVWNRGKNSWHAKGKTVLERLKWEYGQCKREKDNNPPESLNDFQKATIKFHTELAKAWFEAGEFDDAADAIIQLNEDTGGSGNDVTGSAIRIKILDLWYDDLIGKDLAKELKEAEDIDNPLARAIRLKKINKELDWAISMKANLMLRAYTRP